MNMTGKTISHNDHFVLSNLKVDPRFQFKPFTQQYLEQVITIFTRSFCLSEPMTAYLKLDMELYKVFARAVAEKAIVDKLSVVALDGDQVVACALVEDLADPCPIPDFDPKFKYILNLLEKLGESYFSGKVIKPKDISHLFITVVDEKYRGKNLSTQINFHAMNISSQAGFKKMYCEFTHEFNEKGVMHHLKMPYQQIGYQIYQDFHFENEKPFSCLTGRATSYLWEI